MKKILAFWNHVGIWISGITLIAMMALTTADVIGRYLFKHPISGTGDLTEVMMVIIVFLALSDVASSEGHICVELFTSRLSAEKMVLLKTATLFLSGLVAAVLAWQLGVNTYYTYNYPENSAVLDIPKAPFLAVSAIGCGMVSLAFMSTAGESLLKFLGRGK